MGSVGHRPLVASDMTDGALLCFCHELRDFLVHVRVAAPVLLFQVFDVVGVQLFPGLGIAFCVANGVLEVVEPGKRAVAQATGAGSEVRAELGGGNACGQDRGVALGLRDLVASLPELGTQLGDRFVVRDGDQDSKLTERMWQDLAHPAKVSVID